jgi:hypothetical protein
VVVIIVYILGVIKVIIELVGSKCIRRTSITEAQYEYIDIAGSGQFIYGYKYSKNA